MSGNTRVKGSEITRSKPGAARDYRSKQEVSQIQGNVWKRRGKREGRERNGLRARGCFPRPLIDLRSVYDVAFMYDAFMFSISLSHASVFTCKVSFTCKDVWHPYTPPPSGEVFCLVRGMVIVILLRACHLSRASHACSSSAG